MKTVSSNVLNTLAASGADIALSGHKLKITGAPEMDYRTIQNSDGILPSLAEGFSSVTITPTVVTPPFYYAFKIRQFRKDKNVFVEELIGYTSTTGDTAITICDKLRATIAIKDSLSVTLNANGSNTVVINGKAGAPTLDIKLVTLNLLQAASQQTAASTGTSTTSPTDITATAHGFSVGQIVIFVPGNAAFLVNVSADNKYRVSASTANTLKLTSVDGKTNLNGTATSTAGALTLVAQQSRGQYSDLVAKGVSGGLSSETYSTVEVEYNAAEGETAGMVTASKNKHTVYVKDTNILDANYVALSAAITNKLKAATLAEQAVQVTA